MKSLSIQAWCVTGVVALFAGAEPARAVTFSFASDDDSTAFTLAGPAGGAGAFSIRNGRVPQFTPLTLRIDDDNMGQPTAAVPVGLVVDLSATYVGSHPIGSTFNHVYSVSGQYSFVNPNNGAELMRATVSPGSSTMTISGGADSWGSAGSIYGSDTASGTLFGVDWIRSFELFNYLTSLGISPSAYGLDAFGSVNEDFAFTLTTLNAGAGVAIDPTSKLPLANWGAEASHSSHAIMVPSPAGAIALSMAGAGLLARRRRSAR
jgi:hypothetical protein